MEEAQQKLEKLLEEVAEEQGYARAVKVHALSAGGANLTSTLFRATLRAPAASGPRDDLHLFAKVATVSESARRLSPMRCPFAGELFYYTKLQKQFDAIQTRYAIPEEHRVRVPKLYGSHDEYLRETLVLEDLTAQGFRNYDKREPASLEYVSSALELLAKFHALSAAYRRDDPAGAATAAAALAMDDANMRAMTPLVKPRAVAGALAAAAPAHRARLERFFGEDRPCPILQLADLYRSEDGNMLVHGDFKPSNIMHRRRDGKLELALVDFQAVRGGDPVGDLTFFLVTATDEQFRRQHQRAALRLYHRHLAAALRRLNLDVEHVYPRARYEAALQQHAALGLVMAVTLLPAVLADEEQLPAMASDGFQPADIIAEGSALYRDRFNGLLNNYVEWGLL